jgi:hypothetical protein
MEAKLLFKTLYAQNRPQPKYNAQLNIHVSTQTFSQILDSYEAIFVFRSARNFKRMRSVSKLIGNRPIPWK